MRRVFEALQPRYTRALPALCPRRGSSSVVSPTKTMFYCATRVILCHIWDRWDPWVVGKVTHGRTGPVHRPVQTWRSGLLEAPPAVGTPLACTPHQSPLPVVQVCTTELYCS